LQTPSLPGKQTRNQREEPIVKVRYLSIIALASVAACTAPTSSSDSEAVGSSSEALNVTTSTQQAAATAALNVGIAYENNKLPNTGDPLYAQYDNILWAAQMYTVTPDGTKIQFDPNAPGYAFIPNAAAAMLEAAQDNANVASYLVGGLQSCFAQTKSAWLYNFRMGVLKGYQNGKTTTGTLSGLVVPTGMYTPSGYNPASVIDNFSTVGLQKSGTTINVTMTSTTTPTTARDFWFGLLTYSNLSQFSSNAAVIAKFSAGAQTAACTPFNGAGSGGNPSFTITLNGSPVAARFQGVGAQCYSTCTSTMVLDPMPYATPGPYYNAVGLVGPSTNEFGLDYTQVSATVDHAGQWASGVDQNNNPLNGTFSIPVTHKGTVTNYAFQAN
jgi:hypothetical protein